MSDLIFYTNPQSRARTVRWMLEETGAQYDVRVLDYGTTMKSPEFLAINPMGKVPAIRHGDTVVTEVAAIVMYLADQFPQNRLAPAPDSRDRGAYYRWISLLSPLEMMVMAKVAKAPPVDPTMSGYGREEDLLRTFEEGIGEREYLAGDRFSAADLMVAAYLGWYMQFKLLEPRPAFARFAKLHMGRPAAVKANALDEALASGSQKPQSGNG